MNELTSLHCRNAALETELRLMKDQLTQSQTTSARNAALETDLRLVKEQLSQSQTGSIHLVGLFGHHAFSDPTKQASQQQEINNLRDQLDDTTQCNARLQRLLDISRRTAAVLQQREVRRSGGKLRALMRGENPDEGGDDVFRPRKDDSMFADEVENVGLTDRETMKAPEKQKGEMTRWVYTTPPDASPEPYKLVNTSWSDDSKCRDVQDGWANEEVSPQVAATIWKPTSGQARFINWEAFRAENKYGNQRVAARSSHQSGARDENERLQANGAEWDFSREEPGYGSPPRPGSESSLKDGWAVMAGEKSPGSKLSTEEKTALESTKIEDLFSEVPTVETSNNDEETFAGVPTSRKSKWPMPFPRPRSYGRRPEVPLKYRFTPGEHRSLAGFATFIEDMTPEEYEESWVSYARRYRDHSAKEWREYYETEVAPAFRERVARERAPSPEMAGGSEQVASSIRSAQEAQSLEIHRREDSSISESAISHDKRRGSLLIDLDIYADDCLPVEEKVAVELLSNHDAAVTESEKSAVHANASNANAVETKESVKVSGPSNATVIETKLPESLDKPSDEIAIEINTCENALISSETTAVETQVSHTTPIISATPPPEVKDDEEHNHGHQECLTEETMQEDTIETGTARPLRIRSFSKDDVKMLPAFPKINPNVSKDEDDLEILPSFPESDLIIPGTVLITGIPVGRKLKDVLGEEVSRIELGKLYETARAKSMPDLLSANTALVRFYDVEDARDFCRERNSEFIGLLDDIVDSAELREFVPKHGGLRPKTEKPQTSEAGMRN